MADGGASHLHRSCPELLPELVLGDFDSAQPEILESYRERWDPCDLDLLEHYMG